MMEYEEALEFLISLGQVDLFRYWSSLSHQQKQQLLLQVSTLDASTFKAQQSMLGRLDTSNRLVEPFGQYDVVGDRQDKLDGKKLIASGQVGCLVIAGGQGSRLRVEGPKGICPITIVRHKSLFQLLAEKVVAAGKQCDKLVPMAIMTSPLNHQSTVEFFEQNKLFGLHPNQVTFFQQGTLPILDERGNLFLQATDRIAEGPDGNGDALHQFYKQGIWAKWHQQGVRYMSFVVVDNALADPFDAELIGFHQRHGDDIVVKAIVRQTPEESVGLLAKEHGRACVVEYTEVDDAVRNGRDKEGNLIYSLANISLFSFTMDFVKQVATDERHPLPLHLAHKAVRYVDEEGVSVLSDSPNAWKYEKFIFDLMSRASKVGVLVYPRSTCFAPLKQFSGNDSFETVAAAIEAEDRRVLSQITGTPCAISPLEISQDFYYPTEELMNTWSGRTISNSGYIEAALKCKESV